MEVMIDKLPPLRKYFKNYLEYKCKKIDIKDLMVWLRIEKNSQVSKKELW
jgi:hypothetical protein